MSRKTAVLCVWCLAVSIAPLAFAAPSGLKGIVANSAGQPLDEVTVVLTGVGFEYEKAVSTNRKGRFSLAIRDSGRDYSIQLAKEGFVTLNEAIEIPTGQIVQTEWILYTNEEAASQTAQIEQLAARDKATKAFNAGATAYNEGDIEGALEHFGAAVEANPGLAVGHAALARLHLERESWAEARAAAEGLLEADPEEPLGLQYLYDAYWGERALDEAAEVMDRLVAMGPNPAVAARVFNQAVAATKENDYDTAQSGFEQAYAMDPSLHQALLPLAQIHFANQEWQAAIDKAETYLASDSTNARAHIVRYVSYEELGNMEQAKAAFEELRAGSPSAAAEMFFRDGVNFFNNGDIAEATKAFQDALSLDPTAPRAHYRLGLCYASAGENTQAKASLEKFLELAPDDPEAGSVREMLSYLK